MNIEQGLTNFDFRSINKRDLDLIIDGTETFKKSIRDGLGDLRRLIK